MGPGVQTGREGSGGTLPAPSIAALRELHCAFQESGVCLNDGNHDLDKISTRFYMEGFSTSG